MSSLHRERGEYITAKEHVMTKGEQRGVLPVVVTSEHATVLACVCVCVPQWTSLLSVCLGEVLESLRVKWPCSSCFFHLHCTSLVDGTAGTVLTGSVCP